MTDELKIELALDLIRKGIQEGDTAKVFVVFAPQVLVKGKNVEVKSDLAKKLQAVFEDPSERRLATDGPVRPSFSRVDNPRRYSKFWDFDIVDPRTTIEGDSAFVDCELVLWGAPKDVKSQESGTRVSERFAFYSPPKVQPVTIPEGSLRFPPPPPGKNLAGSKRGWQLVGYENLVEFLENQVKANAAPKAKAGVEK